MTTDYFDKLNAANSVPSGEYITVMNARDVKQVKNITTSIKNEKKLSKDEIYNLILLGYHKEGFVYEIKVFPDIVAILGFPEMLDVFNKLLDIDDTSFSVCMGYDTTFNLGDFYVIPLIFRHVLFESKPSILLTFFVHERKYHKMSRALI